MKPDTNHASLTDRGPEWAERWRAELRTKYAQHAATGKTAAEALGALVASIVMIEGAVEIVQIKEYR